MVHVDVQDDYDSEARKPLIGLVWKLACSSCVKGEFGLRRWLKDDYVTGPLC